MDVTRPRPRGLVKRLKVEPIYTGGWHRYSECGTAIRNATQCVAGDGEREQRGLAMPHGAVLELAEAGVKVWSTTRSPRVSVVGRPTPSLVNAPRVPALPTGSAVALTRGRANQQIRAGKQRMKPD